MHLNSIVGMNIKVSKIDQLKVLVPFFLPALQVFNEKVLMLYRLLKFIIKNFK